ncbi:uncharacterized protein B0H18DRAFT_566579 [Fomitopsis serialis]|uniref:uncharacterized protein n=1 Tax=Fomitopsis serialis TaxID=139415 RepID=UPI002007ABAE|nr:uncharacterized protein B0H18DRAFT_566579 [Neoantrodia serialis]KAH9921327.1 hypothetical protein B0H18DRAFT_566579 [Neoantrodia serialis]
MPDKSKRVELFRHAGIVWVSLRWVRAREGWTDGVWLRETRHEGRRRGQEGKYCDFIWLLRRGIVSPKLVEISCSFEMAGRGKEGRRQSLLHRTSVKGCLRLSGVDTYAL